MLISRSVWLVPIGFMVASGFTLFLKKVADDQLADSFKELDVEVVGSDFSFHFRYPGDDRVFASEDDHFGSTNLYVPTAAVVRLSLQSQDYVYTFEIPEVGTRRDY